jgi:LmbE family N-acetylglucosaminyl deacetylase
VSHPAVANALLVIVAHPDDEALGFAGVIAGARAKGRRVCVAIVTNGDDRALGRLPLRFCGCPRGRPASIARLGLCRGRETIEAMALLGLSFSRDPLDSEIFFLGYPNYSLEEIVRSTEPWMDDQTRLHRTYATGGAWWRCDGDVSYLLRGQHSRLYINDLQRDIDDLLKLTQPSDVYTHVEFDGHPDHAEVYRLVIDALRRRRQPVTVHSTLIHPTGTRGRMHESAYEWPNPSQNEVATPFDRFTPQFDFNAPPGDRVPEWGPLGPPNEWLEAPLEMQESDPAKNLKWQVIAKYSSQIDCTRRGDSHHASCGYLRAFVKRAEFFWTVHINQ